jgi:hypothetical protein
MCGGRGRDEVRTARRGNPCSSDLICGRWLGGTGRYQATSTEAAAVSRSSSSPSASHRSPAQENASRWIGIRCSRPELRLKHAPRLRRWTPSSARAPNVVNPQVRRDSLGLHLIRRPAVRTRAWRLDAIAVRVVRYTEFVANAFATRIPVAAFAGRPAGSGPLLAQTLRSLHHIAASLTKGR